MHLAKDADCAVSSVGCNSRWPLPDDGELEEAELATIVQHVCTTPCRAADIQAATAGVNGMMFVCLVSAAMGKACLQTGWALVTCAVRLERAPREFWPFMPLPQ